jgi:hypothetical protein
MFPRDAVRAVRAVNRKAYAFGVSARLRVLKQQAANVPLARLALTRSSEMISRRSIDLMLDLIENRVACMQVIDREDHRQLAIMTQARRELLALRAGATAALRRAEGPVRHEPAQVAAA